MAKTKKNGRPLPDTPAMQMWREEYEHMSLEEHEAKLRELGLGEEEIGEFREVWGKEKKKK